MHFKYILLSLAGLAAANIDNLIPRQTVATTKTSSSSTSTASIDCTSKFSEADKAKPTPPSRLVSAFKEKAKIDECNYSVSRKLRRDYSSYRSAASSWAVKYVASMSSCSNYQASLVGIPTQCLTKGTFPTSAKKGLAARETGAAVMALAAAGMAIAAV